MSYFASVYVNAVLWLGVRDSTAGFKCYRAEVLRTIDLDRIRFIGYAFQIEMKYNAWKLGFRIDEVPITFVDRELGTSKMSKDIFKEAFLGVLKCGSAPSARPTKTKSMTATPTRFIRASIVNEGKVEVGDVLMRDGTIGAVGAACDQHPEASEAIQIDAQGLWLMPGAIDDQVHFREPGLTHKGEIATESAAAAAGGITSFMEMPNTVPQALTQLLEDKYERAAEVSAVNYSFFMGASNDNLEEVLKTDPRRVCGVKVFAGSSTGNMLVDNRAVLEAVFKKVHPRRHPAKTRPPFDSTPRLRAATVSSFPSTSTRSSEAPKHVTARPHGSGLGRKVQHAPHILHISTAEVGLFLNDIPSTEKRIAAQTCIHHLWFTDADYALKSTHIKWNPAVKTAEDREAIYAGILNGRIDVVATDHAPHTAEEKSGSYFQAPSGGPLVQHALPAMLEMVHKEFCLWRKSSI